MHVHACLLPDRPVVQVLQRCGMRHVPPVGDVQEYLERGPGFIFLFHPALGPLWDVIAQKIRGGALLDGSELVLEVAEARLLDVTMDGSLLVYAENVMGHSCAAEGGSPAGAGQAGVEGLANGNGGSSSGGAAGRLQYSSANGRVHLMNVTVQNVGVDWHHPGNVYWQHKVLRHEACRVVLHGRSEFEAYDCKISGAQVRPLFWWFVLCFPFLAGPVLGGFVWCFSFFADFPGFGNLWAGHICYQNRSMRCTHSTTQNGQVEPLTSS